MPKDKSFWASWDTVDGHAWANSQAGINAPGERRRYATMSEATRAEVVKAAAKDGRRRQTGVAAELTTLIAECYMLHGRLSGLFAAIKDSAGLSGVEAMTLYATVDSQQPVTVPQIGRSLGHARQVIQRAAHELEQRGLVETRDNPGHKRAAFLVPTDAGRKVKAGFEAAGNDVAKTLVGGMDVATIRATHAGLNKLRRNVEERAREREGPGKGPAKQT